MILFGLGLILCDPIPWGPITVLSPSVTMYNLRCLMQRSPRCHVGTNRRGCDHYLGQDHQLYSPWYGFPCSTIIQSCDLPGVHFSDTCLEWFLLKAKSKSSSSPLILLLHGPLSLGYQMATTRHNVELGSYVPRYIQYQWTSAEVGKVHINPRFHATGTMWSLGLPWKLPPVESVECSRGSCEWIHHWCLLGGMETKLVLLTTWEAYN